LTIEIRENHRMIANIEPAATKASASIYHLKILLNGTKLLVWRRLQVPGNASLGWLHAALQLAMGWTNSHLHQFRAGERIYSDLRHNFNEYEGDPEILDEYKTTLQRAARRQKDVLAYEYDFGDSWHHQIIIEKILSPDFAERTNGYNHDANDLEFHRDLLKLANRASCMVFISGYANELYRKLLTRDKGWSQKTIEATTRDSSGRSHKRTEIVWMNKHFREAQETNEVPIVLTKKETKQTKVNPSRTRARR
jgi:hypothetical protein